LTDMSKKPSSSLYEMLSALADGEASSFEQRRILQEMSRDRELRLAWQRMLLVRSALRDEARGQLGTDVSERVRQALSAEPSRPVRRRWVLAAAGGGVAAALLAAILFLPGYFPPRDAISRTAVERYMEWHSELPDLPALGSRRARLARPVSLAAAPQQSTVLRRDGRLRPVSWLRQGEVEILRFTDGLQTISVFMEPIAEPESEQVRRQGSMLAYSRTAGEGQDLERLTVVGELSLEKARAIIGQVIRHESQP